MPIFLKDLKTSLKRYRPMMPSLYPRLKVSELQSKSAFGIKSVTYKSIVASEETSRKHITFVRFFDVEFVETKDAVHSIPASVKSGSSNILRYHGPHIVTENRVQVKCSCEDFRFAFEHQCAKAKALIGGFRKYKRLTPPKKRPLKPKNPNPIGKDFVNPDNHEGYCKHVHSLLMSLKSSKLLKD